jgi:hypothetical protein
MQLLESQPRASLEISQRRLLWRYPVLAAAKRLRSQPLISAHQNLAANAREWQRLLQNVIQTQAISQSGLWTWFSASIGN